MTRCNSCQAPILWVRTQSGREMPVDREPSSSLGNIELGPAVDGPPTIAGILSRDEASAYRERSDAPPLYVSHFATCPNAKQYRKERGK